jgi:predicted  nucleic acid-binding Zn-ribbon protein
VLSVGGIVYAFLTRQSTENMEAIAGLRRDMDDARQRVGTLEEVIKHLPDKDSVHKLDIGLTEVRGKIETINVSVTETSRTAHRIENALLSDRSTGAA